jgi:hypothetical protein
MNEDKAEEHIEQLLDTPGLADALESDRFKQFLDHVPVAIAVSELDPSETITYANRPRRCRAEAGRRFPASQPRKRITGCLPTP